MGAAKAIIVENERLIALGLAQMLRALGYEVSGLASDASQLATLLGSVTPDLIALDLDLGEGAEGLGIATVLQATGPVPIVFLAAQADEQQRESIRAIEGTALLVGPFTEAELRVAVALALKRTEDSIQEEAGPRP